MSRHSQCPLIVYVNHEYVAPKTEYAHIHLVKFLFRIFVSNVHNILSNLLDITMSHIRDPFASLLLIHIVFVLAPQTFAVSCATTEVSQ